MGWLTADEVETLTNRKRWSAQARKLATMGIPFRPSAEGRPLVERSAIFTETTRTAVQKAPRWDKLKRAA